MTCLLCGLPLEDRSGKRGRPAEMHPECRKVEQLTTWLDDLLPEIEFSDEAIGSGKSQTSRAKMFRSRLWSMANHLNKKKGGC